MISGRDDVTFCCAPAACVWQAASAARGFPSTTSGRNAIYPIRHSVPESEKTCLPRSRMPHQARKRLGELRDDDRSNASAKAAAPQPQLRRSP